MIATSCDVTSIEKVTASVYKIILTPRNLIEFKAGQYIQVVMGDKDKRPFSIANTPQQNDFIELHIGADPANSYAYEVLVKCQNERQLDLEVGLGNAFLRLDDDPVIVVAGGTGYSYAKSIVYGLIQAQPQRNVSLYWGGKTLDDLYEHDALKALSVTHPHFTFHPVVEHQSTKWDGHVGWVHKAVLKDHPSLIGHHVYAAGRFEMAGAIRDDYLPAGLDKADLFGDAFAYI